MTYRIAGMSLESAAYPFSKPTSLKFPEIYSLQCTGNILSRTYQVFVLYSVGKAALCNRFPRAHMLPEENLLSS